ncbi:TPA: replication protein [Pseudomonas aeruginosa 7D9A]|uniref:replication protein n=1 Tax=Pseudomonas aeruginosa TaxID=287 RepID=UPI0003B97C4B|nr:replication protein [Pseudomonas aeruginosa]HCL2813494.1 replication protein [Pseudomonas aeruginosa 7D9A]ERU66914.1 phage replication protein O domain [Pseudomonas aeruginosa C41]MCS7578721.1 replication protein [Pseudomonas aeruginosa]MCS9858763.1 replication protein [Pseudomonas aeruginosa]RUB92667.1 phage replication protein [Pseudomonas aeruginosa]
MSNIVSLRNTGGFTRMDNDLYEALIGADLSGRELRVALAIHRLTAGFNRDSVKVAALYIAKMMYGEKEAAKERANVSRAINALIRQRVLYREGGSRDPLTFLPVSEWKIETKSTVLKSTHCVEIAPASVSKVTHIKDRKENLVPSELVDAERQPEQGELIAETVRKTNRVEACPHQAIVDLYHEILSELPSVALINKGRRQHLQGRWREHAAHRDLGFWREYFESVKASPFLMGKVPGRNGGKPFRATFDWLIAPSNFVKVVEGNYHA